MKRVGYILLTILYIALFGGAIYLNFDLDPKKGHIDGRIGQILECGFDDKYNQMYQAEYTYRVDDVIYTVAGDCESVYPSDVDIIYKKENPKFSYVYKTTWKTYILLALAILSVLPMGWFIKGINKELTNTKKGVILGIDLIITSVITFYFIGERFGFLACFVSGDTMILISFGILILGILSIIFPHTIFKVHKKIMSEDE